jgi:3-oxoacyl-[acyl-carrier protein] reductase
MSLNGVPDHRVLITGRGELADGLARGLRHAGSAVFQVAITDVSRPAVNELVALAEHALNGLDTVVHVHQSSDSPIAVNDLSIDQWVAICEDSMTAAFHVTQAAHRALHENGGQLIFVVPTIGMAGASGFAASAASAESIRTLAKSVAKQWGKHRVTVNVIAVAPQHVMAGEIGVRVAADVSLAQPALSGPGDVAADIAPLVSMLASTDAHFLTGTTLIADGGTWLTL